MLYIQPEADSSKLNQTKNYTVRWHKTRTAISFQYQTGDQIYYKKDDSQYWKGPGRVTGYDNKQVFVRHGGAYLRVNPCNLHYVKETKEVSQREVVDNGNSTRK